MELYKYSGHKIRIICKTGNVFEGLAYDYIPPQDNEPEEASITIDSIEILNHHWQYSIINI